jgi:hypothetical protein
MPFDLPSVQSHARLGEVDEAGVAMGTSMPRVSRFMDAFHGNGI